VLAETLDELTDESLMERVRKHDHQAFSVLVQRRADMFYAAAYRMVMNREEAEDIVQEAFVKLWHKPKIWKAGKQAKFTTWFYRIVMNLCIDHMRKNNRKNHTVLNDDISREEPLQDQEFIKSEEQKFLHEALQQLPENQLMALNLCFYEGFSNKEAAEIMDVNIKGLESLLMRAKNKIKDTLIHKGIIKQEEVA
jgi:RNA polymerase sigma-70 factor (ECF subfamily)